MNNFASYFKRYNSIKHLASTFLLLLITQYGFSQKTMEYETSLKPKLVVGIVIDQMRYDFLTRFYHRYGEGGFKRLVEEGYNCKNNHFNYIPTKTAPGHASIFTGSTPNTHGIIGNDWYDRSLARNVYCVNDTTATAVGTTGYAGQMSPHRMLVTTFADENRLFTQLKGKTISLSIKDRGAILPGGHTANGAYWYDMAGSGNWVTSSFYMASLPKWVDDFNKSDKTESYFKVWDTYYPIDTYSESGLDLNEFEGGFSGKEGNDFPYDLNLLKDRNNNYNIIAESAFGNNLTTDFAIEAIKGEGLGNDSITDILTISYSSTDKVGHRFGPNSKEIEDTYIRLDQDIENLLNSLDTLVGMGEYTIFLTADHGAVEVPNYLKSLKIPSGLFNLNTMRAELNEELNNIYQSPELILSTINNQIYLNHGEVIAKNLDLDDIMDAILIRILKYDQVDKAYKSNKIAYMASKGSAQNLMNNGYHQKRSGDIMFQLNPSYFKDVEWNRTGTDHGTGLNYDTHVPLIFFGKGIRHGSTLKRTSITDIAPTMSALLNISFPNGSTGNPLEKVLK